MVLAGGMAPGVGAHYQVIGASDLTSLDGSFNPSEPASWIYASTANAAPIVAHRDGTIGVQNHIDARAMPGQRFIDRVINDFINHVMQA